MADPFVGKVLSNSKFTVTSDLLNDFHAGLNLNSADGDSVPVMITTGVDNAYFRETAFPYQIGHLWMRQEWELHQVLKQESAYDVSGEIVDIYDKRNRQVVKYRVDLSDEAGDLAVRSYHHQSFLKEQIEGDNVELRDPSKKPGSRKFEVPRGKRFGGLEKVITKEMCGVFFHGDANYHTDDEAAKELGFQRVVVGGRMTMSYVGTVLSEMYGTDWDTSGKLDLKFTNPVWCDDVVTVHGVELEEQNDPSRRQSFLWMQKQDGSIAYVAEANVAS